MSRKYGNRQYWGGVHGSRAAGGGPEGVSKPRGSERGSRKTVRVGPAMAAVTLRGTAAKTHRGASRREGRREGVDGATSGSVALLLLILL